MFPVHCLVSLAAVACIPHALAQLLSVTPSVPVLVLPSSTVAPVASSVAPTTAAAVPTTTAPPALVLPVIGTIQACATARLNWQLRNVDPNLYTVTFRAHNSGINQAITSASSTSVRATSSIAIAGAPSSSVIPTSAAAVTSINLDSAAIVTPSVAAAAAVSSSTSISRLVLPVVQPTSSFAAITPPAAVVARQAPLKRTVLSINQTMGTSPAVVGYSMPVNLPEGQYILVASVPQLGIASSVPFTVLEGDDTSCLAAFAASSAGLKSSKTISSTTGAPSGSLAASNGDAASSGGVSTGAIVGAVIGVLAGLAIIGLLAFCLIRRRRRRNANGQGRDMQENEKAFHVGGGKRSISRPQRLPSEGGITPPASRTSHDPHPPTSATAFAAAYTHNSQRGSISSTSSPYGRSPADTPPRIPEDAAPGAEGEYDDPFATPGLSAHRHSGPTTPAAGESGLDTSRRASSPVALTSPFGAFTPTGIAAGPAYPAPVAQGLSRSLSVTDGKRLPSPPGGSGTTEGMARRGSTKRKAVPSLGPELRKQMERADGAQAAGKKQFALVPDMPGASATTK